MADGELQRGITKEGEEREKGVQGKEGEREWRYSIRVCRSREEQGYRKDGGRGPSG